MKEDSLKTILEALSAIFVGVVLSFLFDYFPNGVVSGLATWIVLLSIAHFKLRSKLNVD